jgi:hypothetical protein
VTVGVSTFSHGVRDSELPTNDTRRSALAG